jgi:hypothetical protein
MCETKFGRGSKATLIEEKRERPFRQGFLRDREGRLDCESCGDDPNAVHITWSKVSNG